MSPIDHLLKQALHEIQSPKATPGQQAAWARIAEHALRCLPGGEERIASALATAAKVFGSPEAVYRLVEGVQVCESDGKRSDRDRVARWVTGLADKAIRGEHWATFAELACHAAILLNAVERDLPPEWERALRAALEAPDAWISLYMFAHHYIDTFKPRKKSAPDWLHLLHSDQRLYDAVDRGLREAGRLYCSACKRMTYQRTLSDDDALAVYDALLKQALREIRSTASGRAAWGRIAEHALSCLPESEERIADALATAGKALDSHECVRRLVEGVRVCVEGVQYSDDDRARTRRWGASMADRAIRGERWATFAELACHAVSFGDFKRELSPEWDRALRAAHEVPDARGLLGQFAHHYIWRFEPDKEGTLGWLYLVVADRRICEALNRRSSRRRPTCFSCSRLMANEPRR